MAAPLIRFKTTIKAFPIPVPDGPTEETKFVHLYCSANSASVDAVVKERKMFRKAEIEGVWETNAAQRKEKQGGKEE